MTFRISSPAFDANAPIPSQFTCDGDDISPPLRFGPTPPGTKSLVLIVDDPDAPDPAAPKRVWVHWVVYDLPASTSELIEDAMSRGLPPGAREGMNDSKTTDYSGPCPPIGRHRYFFKLYALDTMLGDLRSPTKAALLRAMDGHVIGSTEIVGTYERSRSR